MQRELDEQAAAHLASAQQLCVLLKLKPSQLEVIKTHLGVQLSRLGLSEMVETIKMNVRMSGRKIEFFLDSEWGSVATKEE